MKITTKPVCSAWGYVPGLFFLQRVFESFLNKWFPTFFIFLSLLYGTCAGAGDFTVFGPQIFQRTSGSAVTETAQFTVLDPSINYNVVIHNGGMEDDAAVGEKVSSGIITVNGTDIVQQSNFNQNTSSISEAVSLLSSNELSVTLHGKPGGQIALLVVGQDNIPPVITASINPAPDSSGWNYSSVTVSFECSDATSGISSCSEPVVLNADGAAQQVTGVAIDNAGNTTDTVVTVNISLDQDGDGVSNNNDTCSDTPTGEAVDANGCGQSQLDTDSDGVFNNVDTCASTPTGEVVDVNGCGQSQLDADGDGVFNNADTCASTPAGEAVDANGCGQSQLDTDADGVFNNVDTCASTPAGEAVDVNGCGQSQLDADADGVFNNVDTCASTPAGEAVDANGCGQSQLDADSDGVFNNADTCASTPAGEIVDANGCGQSQLDADADGVFNNVDTCASTPAGEAVDANGCGQSQLDADADGVFNNVDTCASTPTGETVDANGCSPSQLDADNDGASDAIDQCANTPAGEAVDANGCGQSQLDADADGVFNNVDTCAGTPAGEAVDANGCGQSQLDADSDGVFNNVDTCASTPAGETVDANGCSPSQLDADNDGITDSLDQCLNTPAGETVDANGCGQSQLDADGDGVFNNADTCASTPAGEAVDANGCSASQMDTDSDGVNDALDQCPNTVPGTQVAADGCDESQRDTDGDGTLDIYDAFPNDPSRISLPIVTIDSPQTLTTFGSKTITVTGTADEGVSLTVNGVSVTATGGTYSASVVLEEGHNTIVTRLVTADGVVSTASISVSLDLTPPYITVESHTEGQVVNTATIAIAGLVNDIVRGTVEAAQANVSVNGVQATISNRSYQATGISLVEGNNQISIVAADQVGNTSELRFNLEYQPIVGQHLEIVSGQNQSGLIEAELTEALVIKVLDNNNQPVANKNVVFRVIQGAGILGIGSALEGRGVVVQTDVNGLAQTRFKLGYRSGAGNQKVRARVVGYEDETIFYASATTKIADKLSVNTGNNQRGANFQLLPAPFVVAATDIGSNVVQGSRIQFSVKSGNGRFVGGDEAINGQTITVVTDSDGRASAHLQLGGVLGLDRQRVNATLLDGPAGENITAGFTASAFAPGEAGLTSISGIVLDNQDNPLQGATIRVDGTSRQAIADVEGKFTITEAPVGPVHLIVDGSTTTVAGEYPSLSYNIVTVSGVENPMAAPIYMVKLNTDNAVLAGQADVVLELPDVPGFKLEVPAGSVTFPDGSKEGLLSVTVVNSNKIPMAPPNGMQPQFIVTIQPTGAKFDPPARLSLPNVDSHLPGRQVEMFSYDHDLEEFVSIGLGTVDENAINIRSNPGIGVIKAGWHCGAQPGGAGCCEGPEGPSCDDKCKTKKGSCPGECVDIPGCCEEEPDCSKDICTKEEDCKCVKDPAKDETVKPAKEQKDGDCQILKCKGNEEDLTDNPTKGDPNAGDNQHDCVDTVCEGPPEPDDGEIPEEDCVECKGGGASPVTGHVAKRKQLPDDCKVLYCDGKDEDAPGEVIQTQTPYDCKEVLCDGSIRAANDRPVNKPDDCQKPTCDNKNIVMVEANEPPADSVSNDCFQPVCIGVNQSESQFFAESLNDPNQLDCKLPICDAGTKSKGVQLASGQKPENEIVDACNKKNYECTQVGDAIALASEIEKITGAPLNGQKCIKCVDGVSSKNYDDRPVITTGSVTSHPGIGVVLEKVKSVMSLVGMGDLVKGITGTARVTKQDCCNEQSGLKKDGIQNTSGGLTLKIYAKEKPIPALGKSFKAAFDLYVAEVIVDIHAGVVVDADASVGADLGHTLDQCNNNDCYTVGFNGDFTVTPKVTFAAIGCVVTYGSPEVCGGIDIIPAALALGFTANLNYNKPTCNKRWTGGVCVGSAKAFYDIGFNIPTRVNFRRETTLYTGECL